METATALATEAGLGNTADTHLLSLLSLLDSLPSQTAHPLVYLVYVIGKSKPSFLKVLIL